MLLTIMHLLLGLLCSLGVGSLFECYNMCVLQVWQSLFESHLLFVLLFECYLYML